MTKIDAREKNLLFIEHSKRGNSQQAADAIRGIFEPLIRRDNDELEVNDLFDLIAIAAYSAERADQLFELAEMKIKGMTDEEQREMRKIISWMRGAAKCFLQTGFVS